MASIANEPYAAIYSLVSGNGALVDALTGGFGKDVDVTVGTFPKLSWRVDQQSPGQVDAESWLYRDERLQFSLWGNDPDALVDLVFAVDALLNDASDGGAMDSANWTISLLRRIMPWAVLPYRPSTQTTAGPILYQQTSLWRFKALRKQS